ncbi:limulus clotting factor C-like isoform X2 [Bradysia coprophila]|uniref:limulus clotting factor C-like isoform X2 n=1 Tax=Bradysia coprophila TaxID=38358 RepID=UPI00187D8183|nr:limulus clotting factor C-like isoform X2 [Bradysia coprophila]
MKLFQTSLAIILLLSDFRIIVQAGESETFTCGRRLVNHEALIVNGHTSKEGDWPWHTGILHIEINRNIEYKCGGTLLNTDSVLTAAHCVYENDRPIVPDRVLAQLGRHNLKISGTHSQDIEVYQIFIHPNYNASNLVNDIAIMRLATKATFNNYVQPICLWDSHKGDLCEVVGKYGTVVGFGITEKDEISYTLRQAVIPVVDLATCLESDRNFFGNFLSDSTFCAGNRNGTNACNGDSGGGLTFAENGAYRIRGIVSLTQARSESHARLCKTDQYVVFTDVAKYVKWIRDIVPGLPSAADCTHFTWTNYNDGTCWMKRNRVTANDAHRSVDRLAVCGIVENVSHISWNESNLAFGCDFWENDLANVKTYDHHECNIRCASREGCTHFVWNDYNGGTCWMKENSVGRNDAFVGKDRSVVCGIVGKIDWNSNNWALGCDFRGNDLIDLRSRSHECGGYCAASRHCTHFTWNAAFGGTCWMKQHKGVTRDDALVTMDSSSVCGIN